MSKKLMEVREKFSEFLRDPAHLDATSPQIAAAFFEKFCSEISEEAWAEVTKAGLVHMLGGLRTRRRPPVKDPVDAPDLFAGFNIEPIVVVRVSEASGGVVSKNKDRASLTLAEALDYLNRFTKERTSNLKKAREWRRLISRVRPFMTKDGMTLGEGLRLAQAAEAKKKKADKA